ncbi:MAG: hypothetical protein GY757_58080 [bacterium]|nr:hypothetical protein [bacterium]
MDEMKFKDTEKKYSELKKKLDSGELKPDEMKKELKKMMVLDDAGSYWMIGGKTGRWYIYNGTDWKEGNPFKEKIDITPAPNTVSALKPELQVKPQTMPQKPIQAIKDTAPLKIEQNEQAPVKTGKETEDSNKKPFNRMAWDEEDRKSVAKTLVEKDGSQLRSALKKKKGKKKETSDELVITSIKLTSLMFFLGGPGLILGVLLGAGFGISKSFPIVFPLEVPEILENTRGGLAGGLIFAAFWGSVFAIASAIAAAVLSTIYNLTAFLFGGVRVKIKK